MKRPSIDEYYLAMLPLIASRGTCPRRQVGAVLVDRRGRVVTTGYNGQPHGMHHCTVVPCAGHPELTTNRDACEAIHAEHNALLLAGTRAEGCTLYCSVTPCFTCAKLLITACIFEVVVLEVYKHDLRGPALLERVDIPTYVMVGGERKQWHLPTHSATTL